MEKKNIRFLLQYDGSRYDGWQKQGNTENTIQGRLEQVLSRLAGEPVEVFGAGRTDEGVHALGQVANARLVTDMTEREILDYVNRYLPDDILALRADRVPDRFHSRLNAAGKVYLYRIDMAEKSQVFQRRYIYTLGQTLDVEAMRQAAVYLTGTHDFRSFCAARRFRKPTVRTIQEIRISCEGSVVELRFGGDGFLYHMVRILTGTLIEVGQGKRTPESMTQILEAEDRDAAGFTAPARGLFLAEVLY